MSAAVRIDAVGWVHVFWKKYVMLNNKEDLSGGWKLDAKDTIDIVCFYSFVKEMVTDLKRAVLKAKTFQVLKLLKASKPHSDSSNQLCAGHTSRTLSGSL